MPRFPALLILAAVLAAWGCSTAAPDDGLTVTGTYAGRINASAFDASVRLVARESANGTVTGTFILDSGRDAVPYAVRGTRTGADLPLTFTADTPSFVLTYRATVSRRDDGTIQLSGSIASQRLGLSSTRLDLRPVP